MVQLVQHAEALQGAGQHFMVLVVGKPVFFCYLGEINIGVDPALGVEDRVSLIQVKEEGDGILAAQIGFLGGIEESDELIDGGGLFHAQLLKPVAADEVAHIGDADAAGGHDVLFLDAVAVHIFLAVAQQFLAQEGGQVGGVLGQQLIQLIQAAHVDVLVDQFTVVGQADVGRDAAAQLGGQDLAFIPAGYGHELHLDLVGIAEFFLDVAQLHVVFHIEAGDGAVEDLYAEGEPVFGGKRLKTEAAKQKHGDQEKRQFSFHVYLSFIFYRFAANISFIIP